MRNGIRRKIDAKRLCQGLGRIGYTPPQAICDLVDNAVSAGASNIYIKAVKIDENANDNRRNNVREYLVIDDGCGMNEEEIGNALDIGSTDMYYTENSLSKFGMGLKSASFAQGDRLEVVSGKGGSFTKSFVDLDLLGEDYESYNEELSALDRAFIDEYLDGKSGSIIRIAKIRNEQHPNITSTFSELKKTLGVIYYYFILGEGLSIHLIHNDNSELIDPLDPLFITEANANGSLDENSWDGKTVRWVRKEEQIMLDSQVVDDTAKRVLASLEITMLPHPRVFAPEKSANEIRNQYNIGSKNYGIYIYRNKRLIAWTHHLDGIIPYDIDYYSFRARINIDESADEILNIDVSKSNISLSGNAYDNLDFEIKEYRLKAQRAWDNAYKAFKKKTSLPSVDKANDAALNMGGQPEILPYDEVSDAGTHDKQAEEREQAYYREQQEKLEKEASRVFGTDNTGEENGITPEKFKEFIKGKNPKDTDKVFHVESIEDNILWEPYLDPDPEKKDCVRISTRHTFSSLLNIDNNDNYDMKVLFDLFMLQLARSEAYTIKHYQNFDREIIESVMEEYRRNVSDLLSRMCRNAGEDDLPPYEV